MTVRESAQLAISGPVRRDAVGDQDAPLGASFTPWISRVHPKMAAPKQQSLLSPRTCVASPPTRVHRGSPPAIRTGLHTSLAACASNMRGAQVLCLGTTHEAVS